MAQNDVQLGGNMPTNCFKFNNCSIIQGPIKLDRGPEAQLNLGALEAGALSPVPQVPHG